jgi:hypothetical protein
LYSNLYVFGYQTVRSCEVERLTRHACYLVGSINMTAVTSHVSWFHKCRKRKNAKWLIWKRLCMHAVGDTAENVFMKSRSYLRFMEFRKWDDCNTDCITSKYRMILLMNYTNTVRRSQVKFQVKTPQPFTPASNSNARY